MALAFIGGAALGAALQLLFTSMGKAIGKVETFRSDLNRLEKTLDSIKVAYQNLDHTPLNNETEEAFIFILLAKGEKLVRKCSNVKWNVFKRWYFSKEIMELESSISKFFQIDLAAVNCRERKRVLLALSNLEEKTMTMLNKHTSESEIIVGCAFNSDHIISSDDDNEAVGFDEVHHHHHHHHQAGYKIHGSCNVENGTCGQATESPM